MAFGIFAERGGERRSVIEIGWNLLQGRLSVGPRHNFVQLWLERSQELWQVMMSQSLDHESVGKECVVDYISEGAQKASTCKFAAKILDDDQIDRCALAQ